MNAVARINEVNRSMAIDGYRIKQINFYKGNETLAKVCSGFIENKVNSFEINKSYKSLSDNDIVALDFIEECRKVIKVDSAKKKGGHFYQSVKGDSWERGEKLAMLYIDVSMLENWKAHGEQLALKTDEDEHYLNFFSFDAEVTEQDLELNNETGKWHHVKKKNNKVLFSESFYTKIVKTEHGEKIKALEEFMKGCGFKDSYYCKNLYEKRAELLELLQNMG